MQVLETVCRTTPGWFMVKVFAQLKQEEVFAS